MYGEITLGSKAVPMLTNATTSFRYKHIFHEDLLAVFSGRIDEGQEELVIKLAYVMAKQAEKADMTKLNNDTFMKWLEDFETADFFEVTDDILNLYSGQMSTTSEAKKNTDQQSEDTTPQPLS